MIHFLKRAYSRKRVARPPTSSTVELKKNNKNSLSDALRLWTQNWLPHHLDRIIPCTIISLMAIISAILLIHKIANVLDLAKAKESGRNPIPIQRIYLGSADYLEYSTTLIRLNPGVTFTAEKSNAVMTLAISDDELFPDLMMALHTMQSFRPGVSWEMVEFCVRTCPEKAVARVTVKGFKQELQ